MADIKIYKYTFEVQGEVKIAMPQGSHVLAVQAQYGTPTIWAVVDTEQPLEERTFRLFGIGHPIDIELSLSRYIGTFQLVEGQFVGHLFELNTVYQNTPKCKGG